MGRRGGPRTSKMVTPKNVAAIAGLGLLLLFMTKAFGRKGNGFPGVTTQETTCPKGTLVHLIETKGKISAGFGWLADGAKDECSLKVLSETEDMYGPQLVVENEDTTVRCMYMQSAKALKQKGKVNLNTETCVVMNNPNDLQFGLYKALVYPVTQMCDWTPKRVLVIGVGGGLTPRAYHTLFPRAVVTGVEIQPEVARLAQKFFLYKPDGKHQVLVIEDGQKYVENHKGEGFDVIIIDAFNAQVENDNVPKFVSTDAFLSKVSAALSPEGVMLVNCFSDTEMLKSHVLKDNFARAWKMRSIEMGNIVVAATNNAAHWAPLFDDREVLTMKDTCPALKDTVETMNFDKFVAKSKPFVYY